MRRAAIAAALVVLMAPAGARAQTAEQIVAALAQRVLAGKLSVGRATLGRAIEIEDVTIRDTDGEVALRLGKVKLEGDPAKLYAAGVIDSMEVTGVAIKLRQLPDGSIGLGRIVQASQGGAGGTLAIESARVHGPVVFAMPGAAPRTFELDVSAALHASPGTLGIELKTLVVKVEGMVVGGAGAVEIGASPKVSLRGLASGLSTRLARLLKVSAPVREKAEWPWELKLDADELRAHVSDPTSGLATTLRVPRASGDVLIDGQAHDFVFGETRTSQLALHGKLDTRAMRGKLELTAAQVSSGGLLIGELRGSLTGDKKRLELRLSTDGEPGRLELLAEGTPAWKGDRPESFDGKIVTLRLERRGQVWSLAQPARLRAAQALILDPLTLERQPAPARPRAPDQPEPVRPRGGVERLTLGGRIDLRAGRLDFSLAGQALALSTIASLLGAELALPEVELSARARARGTLGAPVVELTLEGNAAPDPRVGRGPVAVHVVARLAKGRLTGRGEVRSGDAQVTSDFDVPTERTSARLSLHSRAQAIPLAWLSPLVPGLSLSGSATLQLDVAGTRIDPQISTHLTAHLDTGGELDATFRGAVPLGPLAPARAPAVRELDGSLSLRAVSLAGVLPGLPLAVVVDGNLRLSGRGDDPLITGHIVGRGTTAIGELSADTGVRWQRALDLSLDAGLRDGGALLRGKGTVALPLSSLLRGGIDAEAVVAFDGKVPGFDLSPLAPLGGTVEGTVTVHSPLQSPVVRAALSVRELLLGGAALGPATAEATLDRSGARGTLVARPPGGGSLRVDAQALATGRSLRLIAEALRLSVSSATGKLRAAGRLDSDVTITYPRSATPSSRGATAGDERGAAPSGDGATAGGVLGAQPRGMLRVSEGLLELGSTRLEGLSVAARVEPGRLVIEEGAVVHRGGRLTVAGTVALDGLRARGLQLRLRANELPLSRDNLGLWLDADADLRLSFGRVIEGELKVQRGGAHVVRAGAGRTLQPVGPLADVTIVDGRRPAAPPVAFELPRGSTPVRLRIEVPGPFHLVSRELDVKARASLALATGPEGASLRGDVAALPGGQIELFNRRYEIERAQVRLGGPSELDLRITREIGDVLVAIEARGPLDHPKVTLSSDPPVFDELQIGGLVLSGESRGEGTSRGLIGQQMAGVITGVMTAPLKDNLAIDVFKVEPGATAATPTRLEIGKYVLGDRVYVSYVYQFGGLTLPTRRINAHQAQVQLRLVRRLSLDARYGDAGVGALDLTFTLRR